MDQLTLYWVLGVSSSCSLGKSPFPKALEYEYMKLKRCFYVYFQAAQLMWQPRPVTAHGGLATGLCCILHWLQGERRGCE